MKKLLQDLQEYNLLGDFKAKAKFVKMADFPRIFNVYEYLKNLIKTKNILKILKTLNVPFLF